MSFEQDNKLTTQDLVRTVEENSPEMETQKQAEQIFNTPILLNEMLQNKDLLTCYKCKEQFNPDDEDSNKIILGIILNKRTPSSICLRCVSQRVVELITEQFTKNSKDYSGQFFSYEHKFQG